MIELAGTQSLNDLGERDLDCGEIFKSREVETIRHLIAKRAGAAEAASARLQVIVTVFTAVESGRAAVDSVFFDVTTGWVWHEARIPFEKRLALSC
jgi:hypothetical protein